VQPARHRLAEVVAAISLATDLGMGQPLQHALRTCLIATRLADEADLPAAERPVVYYTALLLEFWAASTRAAPAAAGGGARRCDASTSRARLAR
jgi:hypothetical protein